MITRSNNEDKQPKQLKAEIITLGRQGLGQSYLGLRGETNQFTSVWVSQLLCFLRWCCCSLRGTVSDSDRLLVLEKCERV